MSLPGCNGPRPVRMVLTTACDGLTVLTRLAPWMRGRSEPVRTTIEVRSLVVMIGPGPPCQLGCKKRPTE